MDHTSNFVSHNPCPHCGSSDAYAEFDDGHHFCYSCNKSDQPKSSGDSGLVLGTPMDLPARKINHQTCKKFRYLIGEFKGEQVHLATYCDTEGRPVAQKVRTKDKEFTFLGQPKKAGLFGQQLWSPGGKRIVITEGEIDCLSVAQAFNLSWPVVSIKDGASGALRNLKAHMEYLNSFEEIVVWFDGDEPGRKAANEVASLFTPGKVKVVRGLPEGAKDANDVLRMHGAAEVSRAVYQASPVRPDGILLGTEMWSEIESFYKGDPASEVYSTPYPEFNKKLFGGLRKGRLYVFTAGSKVGKSTVVNELGYHLMKVHGLNIGCIELEESAKETALRFMSLHTNKRLNLDPRSLTEDEYRKAFDETVGSGKLCLHNHFGSLDPDLLLSKIRYMVVALKVDFIIFDHISIVVSGLDVSQDERKTIDRTMTLLRSLVQELNFGVLVVSHIRKGDGKKTPAEEGGHVTMQDLRGSGSLYQLADGVIALERNILQSDTTVINLLCNRLSGDAGVCDSLTYNKSTGRLTPEGFDRSAEPATLDF